MNNLLKIGLGLAAVVLIYKSFNKDNPSSGLSGLKSKKVPKILDEFAKSKGLRIVPIGYQGQVGYDIVDEDRNIISSIAPVFYSNGDRWKFSNKATSDAHLFYAKSLKEVPKKLKDIKAGWTGFKLA